MRKAVTMKLFIPIAFILLAAKLNAQKIDAALNILATRYPAEKIYIHYDKDYYVAGETVWFKAYLFSDGKPSSLSNNFYLQLLDEDGVVVSNKKYPVKGATVAGDIELLNSLHQGYYTVRAVTPGMLNTSPYFLYQQKIFVFNPSSKKDKDTDADKRPGLSIHFFPESGYLVNAIPTVVAFKALDSLGMPARISGTIRVNDSVVVASFSSFHDGLGKVQFKPIEGKKYVAAVSYNGQTNYFSLPEVQSAGINLKIEDEKGGKMFLLNRSKKNKDNFDGLTMVGEMNNRIVYENEINFDDYLSVKGHLLTDSLPSGILHFTVFNKEGMPLVERITFVDNGEYRSGATAEIEKQDLGAKAQNIINVVFPEAIQRSCSVSVTALAENPLGENTIISSLLLTGDLKGYIFNPSWYFQQSSDSVKQAMDDLMLTQGWTRFSWKKILAGEFPEKVTDDNYLISVSGFLRNSKTKELVSGGHLNLFLEPEDSMNQTFQIDVDVAGHFRIDSLLFRGKTKFYYGYTTNEGKETTTDIYINQLAADSAIERISFTRVENDEDVPEIVAGNESNISKRYAAGRSKLEQTKTLDPVLIKTAAYKRPIEEVNDKYTSGVFKSMGRATFDNINEPENDKALSVYEFIKRSVKQVMLEDQKFVNRRNFSMFEPISNEKDAQKQKKLDSTMASNGGGGSAPFSRRYADEPDSRDPGKHYVVGLFLNESPVYPDLFKTIRMDEVALIKYYEPGFVGAGGTDAPGGAISVYTKKDVIPEGGLDKLDHVNYNGYSVVKEFYNPDYSIPGANKNIADNRSTLYWNPEIYTNTQSRSVQLKFFNNDFSKRIKLVFEGFDVAGKLIHVEKIIE